MKLFWNYFDAPEDRNAAQTQSSRHSRSSLTDWSRRFIGSFGGILDSERALLHSILLRIFAVVIAGHLEQEHAQNGAQMGPNNAGCPPVQRKRETKID